MHRFYRTRTDEWAGCVRDAVDRGELPATTSPDAVIRAVSAPLYFTLLTTGEPPDTALAHQAADAATIAARNGLMTAR